MKKCVNKLTKRLIENLENDDDDARTTIEYDEYV